MGITSYTGDVHKNPRLVSISTASALLLATLSILLHLFPFWKWGPNPLGYDAGFYRRYLIEPFLSFPSASVPGLGSDALIPRMTLDFLRLSHLSPDIILYGSYIFFFALLPVLVYFFLRPSLGERGAAIGGLFIVCSPVLYNAYMYMLFKNAIALDFLILAFILLERRVFYAAFLLDIVIALTHKTSAIVYLLTLCMLFCISPGRRREYAGHIALTGLFFALANLSLAHQVSLALPSALFLEWPDYIALSMPFFILIGSGYRAFSGDKIPRTLIAFAGVSIAFPLFHLPFYERIFVFSDVALAGLAAIAAEYLMSRIDIEAMGSRTYVAGAALCIAVGLLGGSLYYQARSIGPMLPSASVEAIQTVGSLVPANATILTSANEAPWYEGWTSAHIAAPGLLHDTHNLEAWEALWAATSTEAQIKFLDSFPKPLYISTFESFDYLIGKPASCLKQIAPQLLLDACT